MKKICLLFALFTVLTVTSRSQDSSRFFYEATFNKGVGFELQDIAYNWQGFPTSELLYYSFGGGTGVDARLGVNLFSGFSLSADGSYRLVYISKAQNYGSSKNKSRATIAHKMVGGSLHYTLRSKNEEIWLTGATFNGGPDYYFEGRLKQKKNSEDLDDIIYPETMGFHLEAMMSFDLFPESDIEMLLGMKYRYVQFEAEGDPDKEALKKVDGQGIDFRVGIRGSL